MWHVFDVLCLLWLINNKMYHHTGNIITNTNSSNTNTNEFFDKANMINMYAGIVLVVIGCTGNMFALVILVYSRRRLPRIIGANYLILLTITNTLFLALHFYMSTYTRIVYFFGRHEFASTFLHMLDSNTLACKALSYLKYSTRSLNTMLTVCFCLERLLAVYYPLHMRSLDVKCSILFRVAVLVSFVLPSYSLFLTELVANNDTVRVRSSFNLTASFNFYSLTPTFGQFTCSARGTNFKVTQKKIQTQKLIKFLIIFFFFINIKVLIKFHFVMFLIIFVSYVFASISILAIVMRVKRSKSFLVAFRANSNSTVWNRGGEGLVCATTAATCVEDSAAMVAAVESESSRVRFSIRHQPAATGSRSSFSSRFMSSRSLSTATTTSTFLNRCPSRRHLISSSSSTSSSSAYKIHDTKILSSISLSFVLLNTPYFVVMFVMFVNVDTATSQPWSEPEVFGTELVHKMRIQSGIMLAETLQLVNFSLTGLLFFCSGQIFRLHALKFLRRIVPDCFCCSPRWSTYQSISSHFVLI